MNAMQRWSEEAKEAAQLVIDKYDEPERQSLVQIQPAQR